MRKNIDFTAYEGPAPKDWNKFREPDYENPEFINDEQYGYLKDGGFTGVIALLERTRDQAERGLYYAEKYGLKYYVRNEINWNDEYDPTVFNRNADEYDAYKKYASFAGIFVCDEPNAEKYDALATFKKSFDEFFGDFPRGFFVNLLPTYANDVTQLGCEYPEYIERYINTVNNDFVCFDHYPFMKNDDGDYTRTDYLYNLKIVADACDKNDKELWTFVQTQNFCKRKTKIDFAAISFQLLACLAFGSKNLIYYTYWTWPGYYAKERGMKFNTSLVTEGERTYKYYDAKRVHSFINTFGERIASAKRNSTYILKDSGNMFKDFDENENADFTSNGSLLVGDFTEVDGSKAYLLVNATDPYAKTSIEIILNANGYVYTPQGKFKVENDARVTLGSGEGVYFSEN